MLVQWTVFRSYCKREGTAYLGAHHDVTTRGDLSASALNGTSDLQKMCGGSTFHMVIANTESGFLLAAIQWTHPQILRLLPQEEQKHPFLLHYQGLEASQGYLIDFGEYDDTWKLQVPTG